MKDNRYYTNFGRFIGRYGARNLGLEMDRRGHSACLQSIHFWLKGAQQPRPDTARLIVEIASEKEAELGYKLTFEDIYEHKNILKGTL